MREMGKKGEEKRVRRETRSMRGGIKGGNSRFTLREETTEETKRRDGKGGRGRETERRNIPREELEEGGRDGGGRGRRGGKGRREGGWNRRFSSRIKA